MTGPELVQKVLEERERAYSAMEYGPFVIVMGSQWGDMLEEIYQPGLPIPIPEQKTLRERLMQIDGIRELRVEGNTGHVEIYAVGS